MDISKIKYLQAKDLGKAREVIFSRNGKQVKRYPQDKANEVFCTYQGKGEPSKHFWLHRSPEVEKLFATLFQERKYNQHIHFIEWDDRINCSVNDGICISSTNFFMTKEECDKFLDTIVPYDEVEEKYYKGA